MKLITETTQDVRILTEKREDGAKNYFIEGIFMQSDRANRNNRKYLTPVMEREVKRFQELIEAKRALGELGHPPSPTVGLSNVSHLITSLKMEGKDAIGRAKILDTPMGKIAKNLLDEGISIGVSSRGLGSTKLVDGINEVQDDFHLATIDIVADPSAPDAFVNGIMESAEWVLDSGIWKPVQIESAQKLIRSTSKKDLEAAKLKVFETLLNNIK